MYLRRVKIFLTLVLVVFIVLAVRIGELQLLRGQSYRDRYERMMQDVELLAARRGRIFDRSGTKLLAVDQPCYDVCVDYRLLSLPRHLTGPFRPDRARRVLNNLRSLAGRDKLSLDEAVRRSERTWVLLDALAARYGIDLAASVDQIRRRVERIRRKIGCEPREAYQQHPVITQLSEAEAVAVKGALGGAIGVSVQPGHKRVYPYKDLACHLIGRVGRINTEQIERYNLTPQQEPDFFKRLVHNYRHDDMIGRSGVEKMCEQILRGHWGYRVHDRADGTDRVIKQVPAVHGKDVRLTIDLDLQRALTMELLDRSCTGSAVVISVPDGQVLALVSVPTYDLNEYGDIYDQLLDEVDLPLLDRAVGRRYPPGSTAKVITALAALSTGVVSPERTFYCMGRLFAEYPDRWRCWLSRGHGDVDMLGAIRQSCNVYFYNVGQLLGGAELCRWFRLFGYDKPPGTDLPQERCGLVPDEQWLQRTRGRGFQPGDARLMAIGQGAIEVTPLHVANAMATIARGGVWLAPSVVQDGRDRPMRRLPVRPEHIELVKEAMYQVVNDPRGTSYRAFHSGAKPLEVAVCGKTGTAQTAPQRVDSDGDGRIGPNDKIVRRGNTAWFAGFAPKDEPKIAFAVAVEYVQGGGSVYAAPIAKRAIATCEALGYLGPSDDGDERADAADHY